MAPNIKFAFICCPLLFAVPFYLLSPFICFEAEIQQGYVGNGNAFASAKLSFSMTINNMTFPVKRGQQLAFQVEGSSIGDGNYRYDFAIGSCAEANVKAGASSASGYIKVDALQSVGSDVSVPGTFLNGIGFSPLPGDVNSDGVLNLLDVAPFVQLLGDGTFQTEADVNLDGVVNLLDVTWFIDLFSSP